MAQAPKSNSTWENLRPYVFGGISGMTATSVVHPMDNIKVRIQTLNETAGKSGPIKHSPRLLRTARWMIKHEGFFSLYKGIDAGITR